MPARYTQERVRKAVESRFGPGSWPGTLKILEQYREREPWRVQLACVLLSEGKIEKLKHYVDVALKDYRDVLYWTRLPPEDDE